MEFNFILVSIMTMGMTFEFKSDEAMSAMLQTTDWLNNGAE